VRPAWSEQFGRDRLRPVRPLLPGPLTPEWAFGSSTGRGVRVAVVDSGIDPGHPAVGGVAGAVAVEYDPGSQHVRLVEGANEDLFGHGTACAGIIRRIAPDVELFDVRVLGPTLKGRAAVFAAGLRWAIEHGMQVVNLSLSTSRSEWYAPFHELTDEAWFRNVALVCAASNTAGPSYPSLYASVLSVAAHDGRDPHQWSYNPRPPVEFGAPGIDIPVAWLGRATVPATGNSFAAPHIAGHVARLLGRHPRLTIFQIKTVLHALAVNAAAEGTAG
jgi:subtilisin